MTTTDNAFFIVLDFVKNLQINKAIIQFEGAIKK